MPLLFGGQNLVHPGIDVLLEFLQLLTLFRSQTERFLDEGWQNLSDGSAAKTAFAPASSAPAFATTSSSTSFARSAATAFPAKRRLLRSESGQLFLGHHAIAIGVGAVKGTQEPLLRNFVLDELAILVLVEGHEACNKPLDARGLTRIFPWRCGFLFLLSAAHRGQCPDHGEKCQESNDVTHLIPLSWIDAARNDKSSQTLVCLIS